MAKKNKNNANNARTANRFVVVGRPKLGKMPKNDGIDLADYERQLRQMQKTLMIIQQSYLGTRERAVIVLEGWDTAGKGGLIRRLGWALDPRSFRVYPIAAPNPHEKKQHYMQRFWERLPLHGEIVAFDRSWYGRVLVERVEELAPVEAWKRAYREINEFEASLVADGIRLVKIFLDITSDEQIARFKDRLAKPHKRWKLSYEDFRDHAQWDAYADAIADMMEATSAEGSPWHLVPGNSKLMGRLAAFDILVTRLGVGIPLEPRPMDPKVFREAKRLFGADAVARVKRRS